MLHRPACLLAIVAALSLAPARAEVVDYPLDLPAGEAAFRIPFQVEHPGTVVVDASWTGGRVLSFRVEDPEGAAPPVRQSGPSPQRLRLDVAPDRLSAGPLKRVLLLRSLDSHDAGKGKVTLTLPDDPSVVRAREEARRPKPPPPPAPDPWMVPATFPPEHAPGRPIYEAVEAYRRTVIAPDGARRPDACGWQDDLLRQLAGWRDGSMPDARVASLLEGIAAAVTTVEELRTTRDPILAGPAPEPGLRQRAWASLREQRLRPIHAELDRLTERARVLPHSLSGATWPARMVACLVSGEREVEAALAERAAEAEATAGPAQQVPLHAAAEAFRALIASRP